MEYSKSTFGHLEMSKILAQNNSLGVDIPLNWLTQPYIIKITI